MGSYNADTHPNIQQAQVLLRDYSLAPIVRSLTEQWTIDATNRVSAFRDGTGQIKFKVLYDPEGLDLT